MSYRKQQKLWLKSYNLKKGSRVRVTVGLPDEDWGDDLGFGAGFTTEMKPYVGEIGTILRIGADSVGVRFPDKAVYWFPFFCLEPVGDDPQFVAAIAAFREKHLGVTQNG